MSIRNFSKLIQKTICRQPIQMPKYTPFRNFGSVNPGERVIEINKRSKSKESSILNQQREDMSNSFNQDQMRDARELRKAVEERQGEKLERPKGQFDIRDAITGREKLIFDHKGYKNGVGSSTRTDQERIFDQDKNLNKEQDFMKEKVFDTSSRGDDQNQKQLERGQKNPKWTDRVETERRFEKSDSFKGDLKNQQNFGTQLEFSQMRKQSKNYETTNTVEFLQQNPNTLQNPTIVKDSKAVYQKNEVDPVKSNSNTKQLEDIVSNKSVEKPIQQFNSQKQDLSFKQNKQNESSQMQQKAQQLQSRTNKDLNLCLDLCKKYPNQSVDQIVQQIHKEKL